MKSPTIPQDEHDILNDAYRFLREHNDPPAIGSPDCTPFWEHTAKDAGELVGSKWNNHPLATGIMLAIYNYLEKKCKAKSHT